MAAGSRAEGPWGGVVFKGALATIAQGWPAGLTVLTGDDVYHLDRAQAAILAHLVPDASDAFGLSVVGEEAITTGALVGAARSSGMFSQRRVVLVRDVAALEGDAEPLAVFAETPPEESFVIVRAPKLDRKRKLHKTLAEAGLCLAFNAPSGETALREMAAEIGAMAAARGVRLEPQAAELLRDLCGNDLIRIASELEKLSAWLGEAGGRDETVGLATVRTLVAGSELLSGWELADALTGRDAVASIAAARRLLDAGDEPIRIVGGLASRARALLRAKAMSEAGASSKAIVDASRAWYFRETLAKGLKRYTTAELLAMPARLLEADRSFKSRSLDKGAVLEALVSRLTNPNPEKR